MTHLRDESIDVHGFLLPDAMYTSHGLDVHLRGGGGGGSRDRVYEKM